MLNAESGMRTPFIAANWKMYKTVHEAVVFVKEFRSLVKDVDRRRDRRGAAVHGHPCGRPKRRATRRVGVAAQDVHWEKEGAFTGEISAGDDQGGGGRVT